MIQFQCDYNEGAHPRIIERMAETNMEQTVGYGMDGHCERARELIIKAVGNPEAQVHFLVGGTQTNATVIASLLRPHQGVVACQTGHINVHESGAVEHTGHKVIAIRSVDGKMSAQDLESCILGHFADSDHEHMVQPGMVYISFPTEYGSIYSLSELEDISAVCKLNGLPLFIDGARLGYGLASDAADVTLEDIARLADVFYIGGTKVGALFGEAVVFRNSSLDRDFRYMIKQNGGMLAKGRLLGIQFETLFEDGLYMEISRHAISLANRIRKSLEDKGFRFQVESFTNQLFPIVSDDQLSRISEKFLVSEWGRVDESSICIRICTSWATREEAANELIDCIRSL